MEEVRDESNRFDNSVSRLEHTSTPRKVQTLEFGAKARAGIFYGSQTDLTSTPSGSQQVKANPKFD